MTQPDTSRRTLWIPGALLSVLILALDQATKWWVLDVLRLQEIGRMAVAGPFDLTMVWNRGVSFGFLTADSEVGRWGLVIMTSVIALVFAIWLARADRPLTVIALGTVIGGAIGNTIDRTVYGAVADFIDVTETVPFFPWVFNVADAAINVGAALLILDLLIHPEPKAGGKAGQADTAP
jgi:signal peptidase II